VTFSIPQSEIAHLIDDASQTQITDLKDQDVKCVFGRCRLDLTAFRTGPAEVSAEDGRLAVRLPFRLSAALKGSGILPFAKAHADAQGVATASSVLSVERDWKLHSQSSGRIELGNAHLRVGPLVTNVTHLWDENGENLSKPVWRMLDGAIAQIQLKPSVESFWTRAFAPIGVGKAPRAWLVLRPERIGLMQPEIGNGVLTLSLALAARGQVLVQDDMPVNPAGPLPQPLPLAEPSDRFSVAIPFLLPYARAEQLALAALKRNPPHVAGMRLAFNALHILPSATDMVVEARFRADPDWDVTGWFGSCAQVYLRGTPKFDSATQSFRIADLRYDLASANLMTRILNVFASPTVTGVIGRTLVFDESGQIARLEDDVRTELARPHGQRFSISAEVESFGAPSFAWTRDGFLGFFSATGKVHAAFRY